MAKPLTYNATLVERLDATDALAIFKVRPDEPIPDDPGSGRPFLPGQYVTLGLNNEEQPELGSVRRPMSIASAPEEVEALEFYIRYVSHPESDNPLTHLLWKTRAPDRLFLRPKAVGKFTIEDTIGTADPRLRVCVAAGTGLAPFISCVRSEVLRDPQADLSGWAVLHGASFPADLGYREELEELARTNGLIYRCSVSRPWLAPEWEGDQGRVEDYFLPERLDDTERRLGLGPGELEPDRAVIYICGLQGTIGQTICRLLGRGFVPDNRKLRRALEAPEEVDASLFFEQYDATPVIDVKDPEVVGPLRAELAAALAAGE
jgi:ferredoxin--NADP+ reductase